jgi:hypothetical protein
MAPRDRSDGTGIHSENYRAGGSKRFPARCAFMLKTAAKTKDRRTETKAEKHV